MTPSPPPVSDSRRLIHLALPLIVANLSIPLLGIVDTALLGHLPDPRHLGAVALGANVLSLLLWSFGFLRMGTTGLCAQTCGAGLWDETRLLLWRVLLLAVVLAAGLLVWREPLVRWTLGFWVQDAAVRELAVDYLGIRLWSAPATFAIYGIVGWLLGLQRSRFVMAVLLGMNGVNILLDVYFIWYLDLGSRGAALASLLAEYLALVFALGLTWYAWRRLPRRSESADSVSLARLLHWPAYRALLDVNRHLMVRTALLLGVFLFIALQGERLGQDILAANAILLSLMALIAYFLDSFVHAGETMVGHAVGADDWPRVHQTVRHGFRVIGWLALAISILLLAGETWILSLFSNLPAVLTLTAQHYLWVALIPLIGVWNYQWDGVFIGAGLSRPMQYGMMISVALFALAWWLSRPLGNHGLWLSLHVLLVARALTLWGYWRLRAACA